MLYNFRLIVPIVASKIGCNLKEIALRLMALLNPHSAYGCSRADKRAKQSSNC